jgi:hypothetical protein
MFLKVHYFEADVFVLRYLKYYVRLTSAYYSYALPPLIIIILCCVTHKSTARCIMHGLCRFYDTPQLNKHLTTHLIA